MKNRSKMPHSDLAGPKVAESRSARPYPNRAKSRTVVEGGQTWNFALDRERSGSERVSSAKRGVE
jgi:hypothetical protein